MKRCSAVAVLHQISSSDSLSKICNGKQQWDWPLLWQNKWFTRVTMESDRKHGGREPEAMLASNSPRNQFPLFLFLWQAISLCTLHVCSAWVGDPQKNSLKWYLLTKIRLDCNYTKTDTMQSQKYKLFEWVVRFPHHSQTGCALASLAILHVKFWSD